MRRLRRHLSYANVMATIAAFMALGGTSYAALTITGDNVKDGSLSGNDMRNRSITTSDILPGTINTRDVGFGSLDGGDIADGSLLSKDFEAGQLPAGPQGHKGDTGAKGETGATGADGKDGQDASGGGSTTFTVRTATQSIPLTCYENRPGDLICTGSATVTASCVDGESASGGGHGDGTRRPENGGFVSFSSDGQDRPDPTTGRPTGWTADVGVFARGPNPQTSADNPPVYAVCAS